MIRYIHADATIPLGKDMVICHINNNLGVAGAGFVIPLYRRYPMAKRAYQGWYAKGDSQGIPFALGEIQAVFEKDVWVLNMVAQNGIGRVGRQVDYDALRSCLGKVCRFMNDKGLKNVQMPRIGAGLGGGDWNVIESLIRQELADKGIDVTVCDFN